MLQSGKKIDARIFARRRVFQSIGGSVNQRSRTSPILVRSIGKESLRRRMRPARRVQKASRFPRLWVGLGKVGVRKQVGRKAVARRLGKAMVEAAPAGAGHMRNHAIHHLASLLVGVEVLVKKMAQESAALRYSYRIHPAYWCRGLGIIF